jgi:hypothetical protein
MGLDSNSIVCLSGVQRQRKVIRELEFGLAKTKRACLQATMTKTLLLLKSRHLLTWVFLVSQPCRTQKAASLRSRSFTSG